MLTILRARTLQRYILREFTRVFLLALLACTLFMMLVMLFITAREYEEYGITLGQVALMFPYLLPKPLALAIPLASLIAATLVFGRLCAEAEILAMQSGGVPLRVLALPIVLCTLLLSGVCLWCNQGGLSWGWGTIRDDVLKLKKPAAFIKNLQKEGTSFPVPQQDGSVVRINMLPQQRHPQTDKIEKPIHIAFLKDNQVSQAFLAADHEVVPEIGKTNDRVLALTLWDTQALGKDPYFTANCEIELRLPPLEQIINIGDTRGHKGWWLNYQEADKVQQSLKQRRRFLLQRAADVGAAIVAASPADPAATHLTSHTWCDARTHADAIFGSGGALDRARSEESECQRKLALSFLPLSMGILGLGLGLLVRGSQRLIGFFLDIIVYALLYWPLVIICKGLVNDAGLPVWMIWLPNLVLLGGGYAIWRCYERGFLTVLPGWMTIGPALNRIGALAWRPLLALRDWSAGRLGSKIDGYVAASFLVPLLLVVICVASLNVALDLVEHGSKVIEELRHATEKGRSLPIALLQVIGFYAIIGLETVCTLAPLLVLLAATLCVYVLVRNNEHLIIKSSGVSLQRAFRPILIIAVLFSLLIALMRETAMPHLVFVRDQLRPLVYGRNPYPSALALYTTDIQGNPVLFQMSQYSSAQRSGRDLRVYLKTDARNRRIPTIEADRAEWTGEAWKLSTDPNKYVKDIAEKKHRELPLIPHGFQRQRATSNPADDPLVLPPSLTPMAEWRGGVTPAIIESERGLGPGVMNMLELYASANVKRAYKVELWRRSLEVLMGLLLLWAALPLLLREETRRPLVGVLICIVLGALYWGLNLGVAEAARNSLLFTWAPAVPHIIFLGFGFWQYNVAMET